jgi:transposase
MNGLLDEMIIINEVTIYLRKSRGEVKRNKENRDNTQSKSDKKDMEKNGYYSYFRYTSELFEKQRVLMSNRDLVVKRLVSSINQLNRWVDIVFPKLRQVFKNITAKGAIATLRLFPFPMELSSMEPHEDISGWKSLMKRQPGLKKALLLLQVDPAWKKNLSTLPTQWSQIQISFMFNA